MVKTYKMAHSEKVLLFSVTIYFTTETIMVQGNLYEWWLTSNLPSIRIITERIMVVGLDNVLSINFDDDLDLNVCDKWLAIFSEEIDSNLSVNESCESSLTQTPVNGSPIPIPAMLSTPKVTFTLDKMVTFTSKMVKKFDDQNSIINDLKNVILGLQNNMSSMEAKMQHLQSDNNSLKEKVQHLESDNMNLRSKVDSMQE